MSRRTASVLAVTLMAGPVLSSAAADRVYRVQAGDSLSSLAHRSGVTVGALQRLNGLSGSQLRVGQAIRLPGEAAAGGPRPVTRTAAQAAPVFQRGMAVYYGGRRDSRTPLTAAHLSLPLGTWVEVTHARTGRSVLVLINDRGPFGQAERVIDLSSAAAQVLGILGEGVAPVTLRIAHRP